MTLKDCRILNKNTNEVFFGQIDTEFQGKDFYELVEIPNDGKLYKWNGHQAVEDTDAEAAIAKKKKLITDLQNLYLSFDKGLQVCFSPAKDAVLNYVDQNDYNSAKEVIEKYPLPSITGVDLEAVRQQFLALLK